MKEKFGQWWLDIAKYVATTIIITSFLGDWEDKTYLFLIATIVITITLAIGMYFIHSAEKENKLKKGKKK